ncbi:dihydroneopterin aldolase [Mucilaginibacter litoreus]|uniref:7,8-dihydroneopterin aldolase n=1 Tax=Mucilaginibacter litoreus TaxID=1048221 RepID=A0ABW3ASG8_9SPHI
MIQVGLEGVEFYAYHGFYPEEQKTGTRFLVDVSVGFNNNAPFSDDSLANTVNYEVLYEIVTEEMQHTRKVLETVAEAIMKRIQANFNFIDTIEVTIRKQNPPFNGPVKQSVVKLSYNKQ